MATLAINDAVGGLSEGGILDVAAQQGVLATDTGPYGFSLAVTGVEIANQTTPISGGTATIQGAYGTLTMHADGSYSYAALNNIALPADGFVRDKFTFSVTDAIGATPAARMIPDLAGVPVTPDWEERHA
jgi:VCBS repeat-containing protein